MNAERKAGNGLHLRRPCHLLACGFGSGLSPWLPGTAGSLAAIPFWLLLVKLPLPLYLLMILLAMIAGVYFCHQTAKDMGVHDHGSIVWDEFVGMWITLITIPHYGWQWVAVGFVLFRLFDMWKPWPVCWFDRNVKGGIGIMLDDVVAGIIAAAFLWCAGVYWPLA